MFCKKCASGECSGPGSIGCVTCDPLPDGNGKDWYDSERAKDQEGVPKEWFGAVCDDILGFNGVVKQTKAFIKYGSIEDWDVSQVIDMRHALSYDESKLAFNSDLSKWNLASVTKMDYSTCPNPNTCIPLPV